LSDAVDDLLRRPTQDAGRLDLLAKFCVDAFAREGLHGARGGKANEVGIRGLGRQKDWDLAYVLAGKPRLLISLKSILKNLASAAPHTSKLAAGKRRGFVEAGIIYLVQSRQLGRLPLHLRRLLPTRSTSFAWPLIC
jgi:hypothetical protein